MSRLRCVLPALVLLLLGTPPGARGAGARYRTAPEEPQLLKFHLYEIEAGIEAERESEKTDFKQNDTESTYTRTFIAPTLSLGGSGSIYHPSFLSFSLSGEGAYGDGEEEFESATSSSRDQMQHLENLRGRMDLFRNKPLRGNAYGSYGRNVRDYDFFTRSTVEAQAYGATTLYDVPSLYGAASYSHTSEKVLDSDAPSETQQDLYNLNARKDRRHGTSSALYTLSNNDYRGASSDVQDQTTDHSVAASDQTRFGERDRFVLANSASYSHREASDAPNDQYLLSSALEAEHRANLQSNYRVDYNRFEDPTLTTETLGGNAGLQHQLYDSLQSSLTGQAGETRYEADPDSDRSTSIGVGLAESYRKRLGSQHSLQMDAAVFVDSIDQSAPGRAVNEPHTFPRPPAEEVVVLDLPNVDETSLEVRDAANIRTFTRGIDYEVFPRGSRTELRRIPGGSIPEGGTILVSYNAEGQGSGRYQSRSESYGVRVNLWENIWGVYGRVSTARNDADDDLYVLESTRTLAGSDLNFRHGTLSAEREWYDSDDTGYASTRLVQSLWANPDIYSSANISFSQTFIDRRDEAQQEADYRVTVRYRRSLTRRLMVSIQAGVDRRRGNGVDQDLAVLRPALTYRIGRTAFEASYDYENNLYLDREEHTRERAFASMKRTF